MMKKLAIFSVIVLTLFAVLYLWPNPDTIYYIGSDPSDDYASWTAMQLAVSEAAGDTVSFRKGETFREQITVPASGTSGNPITYTAHGSGADPIINGADLVTGWTAYSTWTEIWSATSQSGDSSWADGSLVAFDRNYRVYIKNAAITISATTIRIEFKAHSTQDMNISNCAIGEKKAASDEYDFNASPVNVQKGSSDSFTITAGTSGYSDNISISIDSNKDYLVAIDVPTDHYHTNLDDTNGVFYKVTGDDETETIDVTGYTSLNYLKYVESIESYGAIGNVWQATCTTEPKQVFFNGIRGTPQASVAACTAENDWYWLANVLYIYSTSDPDTNYTSPGIESGTRDYGIDVTGHAYITIDGLVCKYANSSGIRSEWGCNNCIYQNNTLAYNYYYGFYHTGDSMDNSLIDSNTINYNQAAGVKANSNLDTVTISNNTINNNGTTSGADPFDGTAGIMFWGTVSNVIVESNTIYYNGDSSHDLNHGIGIWFDTIGSGCIARYNRIYNNNSYGIYSENNSSKVEIYYNICHGQNLTNYAAGIYIMKSDSDEVYNNVCYNNYLGISCASLDDGGTTHSNDNIFVNNISSGNTCELYCEHGGDNDGTNGSGNIYIHNCFGAETSNFIYWGANKSTYDAWEVAYGSSTHSVESDPLMTDPANGDFTLQKNSPCRDAGTDVGLTTDYRDTLVPKGSAPDIGAYEYYQPVIMGGLSNPLIPLLFALFTITAYRKRK